MTENMLDEIDTRILAALQRDAQLTADRLGKILNLSPSQAGRRRQRLEKIGLIHAYVAKVNADAIGLKVQAFVQVQMATHSPEMVAKFTRIVETEPRIVAAFTLTGNADYLLRVFCHDLVQLNDLLHQRILPQPAVARVQSQIVMDQLKPDTPLPT